MRTKIRVDGKWYKPVPWLDPDDECDGCSFDRGDFVESVKNGCINTDAKGSPCDDGNEFSGMIFIPATKIGMAEYVAKKLGAGDDDETLLE